MSVALHCDICGKNEKAEEAVNWLQVDRAGIDATQMGQRRLPIHICSAECVRKFTEHVEQYYGIRG